MGPLRFRASSPPWRHSPGLLSTVEALASGIRERGYFRVDRGKLVLVDSFGGWIYGKTCMNGISKIKLKIKETIQNRCVNEFLGRLWQACRHWASVANGADVRRRIFR